MTLEIKFDSSIATLPDNRYFTIGEVSQLCDLNASILRYWESEFPKLKPATRKGNRRYYLKTDILFILKIKHLLYTQGFTIEGARKALQAKPKPLNSSKPNKPSEINSIINELIELDNLLSK